MYSAAESAIAAAIAAGFQCMKEGRYTDHAQVFTEDATLIPVNREIIHGRQGI